MKSIILSVVVALAITSCTNYGKKAAIEGSKAEVYYKGDGVTEAYAKKLGAYLKDVIKYFDAEKRQSVQLMKSKDDGYDIRFVVDKKKLEETAAEIIKLLNMRKVNRFKQSKRFDDSDKKSEE